MNINGPVREKTSLPAALCSIGMEILMENLQQSCEQKKSKRKSLHKIDKWAMTII